MSVQVHFRKMNKQQLISHPSLGERVRIEKGKRREHIHLVGSALWFLFCLFFGQLMCMLMLLV
jgi:hypothetical protein